MATITIKDKTYEIIKDVKDAIDKETLESRLTDFYNPFDYIVGDWAYGKLRLKGFNEKSNKIYNKINDAANIDSYIEEYCAYGCKHFILKRINVDKE